MRARVVTGKVRPRPVTIVLYALLATGCGGGGGGSSSGGGSATTVHPGESIQAAVDAASPGDTIEVLPGDYVEPGTAEAAVRITKSLKLVAKSGPGIGVVRILPGNAQRDGILVEPANAGDPDVQGVEIRGFRIEGFAMNGIRLRHANDFTIEDNVAANNLHTGIWPTLSTNGLVRRNVAYGALDAALWVEAVENVRVIGNEVHSSPSGIEVSVSNDVLVQGNDAHDNSVGIHLNHPTTAGLPESDWPPQPFGPVVVADNDVTENNFPNPVTDGFVGALPAGGGILILGVDDVELRGNRMEDNDFFGIAIVDYCTVVADTPFNCDALPPIGGDSKPDRIRVVNNGAIGNGLEPPDGPFAPLAADLLAIGAMDSCASNNAVQKTVEVPELPPC